MAHDTDKSWPLRHDWWLTDPAVRALSPEERDLLVSLLCLANAGTPRGYLAVAGRALTDERIANTLRIPQDRLIMLLAALLDFGLLERAEHGMLFCRWLVSRGALLETRRSAGQKGGTAAAAAAAAPSLFDFLPPAEGTAEEMFADDVEALGGTEHGMQLTVPPLEETGKESWIPENYRPTTEEWERTLGWASAFWPLLPPQEVREKLEAILKEFNAHWTEARQYDLRFKTRKGKKKSWYMTLRGRIKEVARQEAAAAARARVYGQNNGRRPGSGDAPPTVEQPTVFSCTFCRSAAENPQLPPCGFHQ